jgi:Serine dehydrogenase proteinase
LDASRLRLLRKLERSRGSRVIALVHRQETMSLLGFPIYGIVPATQAAHPFGAICSDSGAPAGRPSKSIKKSDC